VTDGFYLPFIPLWVKWQNKKKRSLLRLRRKPNDYFSSDPKAIFGKLM